MTKKPEQSEQPAGESKTAQCPICDGAVDVESPNFPFCSGRCRLVDLGNWMKGDYTISREIKESDFDDPA